MSKITNKSMLFIDAHVHIHNCFEIEKFFYSAASNFRHIREKMGAALDSVNLMLLTETMAANYFAQLYQLAGTNPKRYNGVTLHQTNEDSSLLVRLEDGQELFLIAGRQIVTAERLEVLALCTAQRFNDGEPITDVIDKVKSLGAIAVVPWGFGKWMGRRGEVMDKLLENIHERNFFLGDNSGRAAFLPTPKHLVAGQKKGIAILPGSDPLPFTTEYWRPGSYGFAITGTVSKENPAADFIRLINEQAESIKPYGPLEHPIRFFRNQIAMQFVKNKC